jgi:acyl carrier protein
MKDFIAICERIQSIFHEELQIDPPKIDDELIEVGILDSMMFVSLLMHLEDEFNVTVAIQDVEISDFNTIEKIARMVTVTKDQRAA